MKLSNPLFLNRFFNYYRFTNAKRWVGWQEREAWLVVRAIHMGIHSSHIAECMGGVPALWRTRYPRIPLSEDSAMKLGKIQKFNARNLTWGGLWCVIFGSAIVSALENLWNLARKNIFDFVMEELMK